MQCCATMQQPCRQALPQRACLPRSSRSLAAAVRCSAAAGQPAGPLPSAGLLRLTAAAAGVVQRGVAAMRAATLDAARQIEAEQINAQIRQSVKQMKVLALVLPLAAVSNGVDSFMLITRTVASFIKLYLLLLFVRVLLSWFPTFQWWDQQPFAALRQVTDPYLKLFSGLVPPLLGAIDLTPLFGFFILQFLAGALDMGDEESEYW